MSCQYNQNLNNIRGRKTPNDIFETPFEAVRMHVEATKEFTPAYGEQKWADPFRHTGRYFDNFPEGVDKDWCEITQGRDMFKSNFNNMVVCSNPPYSIIDKVLDKFIKDKPKVISLLILRANCTCPRNNKLREAGYDLVLIHDLDIYKWFPACIAIWVNRPKGATPQKAEHRFHYVKGKIRDPTIENMLLVDLKKELASRGLDLKGAKADLQQRLREAKAISDLEEGTKKDIDGMQEDIYRDMPADKTKTKSSITTMDISQLFENSGIATSSAKQYASSLLKLNLDEPVKDLSFLRDTDAIMLKMAGLALSTQNSRLIAVCKILNIAGDEPELLQFYRSVLDRQTRELQKKTDGKKSDKDAANWVEFSQLIAVRDEYKKVISSYDLSGTLKDYQRQTMTWHMVASLYLDIPPKRLDYNVRLWRESDSPPTSDNYLHIKPGGGMEFLFNEHKTKTTSGQLREIVPSNLEATIAEYLRATKNDNFLLQSTRDGTRLSENALGKLVKRAFKDTGKNITISLIRKVYITENVDKAKVKESQQLARRMGHSVTTQLRNYHKG